MRAALLRWYRAHRRDLPWRRTRDPWQVWVSEVMLQQTQVATVVPYFERFVRRFPDPAALARATEDEVLGAWSGLGYYRRARALLEGAREVVRAHGGRVPQDPAALRELPGVGRYTAGAIASIAFGLAEPVLDGNVRRVLSRLLAFDARGLSQGAEDRHLWAVAGEIVQGADPGDLNQALMELGALVCVPQRPTCGACPLGAHCLGLAAREPERFPRPRERTPSRTVRVAVAWIERDGNVLVERPEARGPLRGRFDLPAVEIDGHDEPAALGRVLDERHGLRVTVGPTIAELRHAIMNRRLVLDLRECRLRGGRVAGRESLRWLPIADLREAPVSGATQKAARVLASSSAGASIAPPKR